MFLHRGDTWILTRPQRDYRVTKAKIRVEHPQARESQGVTASCQTAGERPSRFLASAGTSLASPSASACRTQGQECLWFERKKTESHQPDSLHRLSNGDWLQLEGCVEKASTIGKLCGVGEITQPLCAFAALACRESSSLGALRWVIL